MRRTCATKVKARRDQVMKSVLQGDSSVPMGSVVEGRLWVFCVPCARKALLDNDEIGGFVWTVCGGCERAEQKRSGAEQRGGMRIQRENTAATPGYRAIEQTCKDRGWVAPMIRTEGVLDPNFRDPRTKATIIACHLGVSCMETQRPRRHTFSRSHLLGAHPPRPLQIIAKGLMMGTSSKLLKGPTFSLALIGHTSSSSPTKYFERFYGGYQQ